MIIRLSGGIVVPPMCPVTHELGLLDAITHGEGISGGSPNKGMARSSSCHGKQGWYWWNSWPIVPRIILFHSMITFMLYMGWHLNTTKLRWYTLHKISDWFVWKYFSFVLCLTVWPDLEILSVLLYYWLLINWYDSFLSISRVKLHCLDNISVLDTYCNGRYLVPLDATTQAT